MNLNIEELVTLDEFTPWDVNRCPAIIAGGVRCKNPRYFVSYRFREYCAYHGRKRPRGKFLPNAEQLAAMDPHQRKQYEGNA